MRNIDSHVHIGKYNVKNSKVYGWVSIGYGDLEAYMNDYGVTDAWLLSHPKQKEFYNLNNNARTLELAEGNGKLKPFCSVAPGNEATIEGYVDKGCKGVGEIKTKTPIDHPQMLTLYRVAHQHKLPVLIHMVDEYCPDIFRLMGALSEIQCNMVFHGWGWWNHFHDRIVEKIVSEHPNVYMDISANSGYKTLYRNIVYTKYFLTKYSNHILYGTDFPMLTIDDGTQFGSNQQHMELLRGLNLPQSCVENIMYKNAVKLTQ